MADDLPVTPAVVLPGIELTWRFSRSSGPGGQSVNTSDTRVELTFDLEASSTLTAGQKERARVRLAGRLVEGTVTVSASEHRSQLRNREAARVRLASLLRDALAPPTRARRPTRPRRGAVEARLAGKRRRSDVKRLRRDLGD